MHVSMSESHRQRKLSSPLAIFFFFFFWFSFFFFSLKGPWPAVLPRLLCEGNSPGLPHLSVSCIRCFFCIELTRHSEQVSAPPRAEGRAEREKEREANVVISHFKIRLFTSRAVRCKAAQAIHFLILMLCFIFRCSENISTAFGAYTIITPGGQFWIDLGLFSATF